MSAYALLARAWGAEESLTGTKLLVTRRAGVLQVEALERHLLHHGQAQDIHAHVVQAEQDVPGVATQQDLLELRTDLTVTQQRAQLEAGRRGGSLGGHRGMGLILRRRRERPCPTAGIRRKAARRRALR